MKLILGFDEKFKRTWKMYLAYCRGGFLNDRLFVSQYLLSQKMIKAIFKLAESGWLPDVIIKIGAKFLSQMRAC